MRIDIDGLTEAELIDLVTSVERTRPLRISGQANGLHDLVRRKRLVVTVQHLQDVRVLQGLAKGIVQDLEGLRIEVARPAEPEPRSTFGA